jgi:hypothetical protein
MGNQTGDLRLTQARFEYRGKVIDQTKYFRYEVFGSGKWREPVKPPQGIKGPYTYREVSTFVFKIMIQLERVRLLELEVSHKMSGEAGQGNYTTGIRWGPVMVQILREKVDVTGMVLEMYRLSDDSFEIDIRYQD